MRAVSGGWILRPVRRGLRRKLKDKVAGLPGESSHRSRDDWVWGSRCEQFLRDPAQTKWTEGLPSLLGCHDIRHSGGALVTLEEREKGWESGHGRVNPTGSAEKGKTRSISLVRDLRGNCEPV